MTRPLLNNRPWTSLPAALALVGAAWIVSTMLANAASAQPRGGDGPPAPPAEALAACKSLSSGQACSVSGQRGTVAGTCVAPQGKALACRPTNAPPPPGGAASGSKR
jgi:hypothetical protein